MNAFSDEQAAGRARAIESLLLERGLIPDGAVDKIVEAYEKDIGPMHGARVVARAWVDAAYRQRLLTNAPQAVAELGLTGRGSHQLVVVENQPDRHNVVVCTLCSCYPWALLGLPPSWYKSHAYRSRIVLEPRMVLRELGLDLPEDVEIRVWDSSSDMRYMVLPERPSGTDSLDEAALATLVTRDAMIGVAKVRS